MVDDAQIMTLHPDEQTLGTMNVNPKCCKMLSRLSWTFLIWASNDVSFYRLAVKIQTGIN